MMIYITVLQTVYTITIFLWKNFLQKTIWISHWNPDASVESDIHINIYKRIINKVIAFTAVLIWSVIV